MAPAYTLTYFNGRGLGEPARVLFKYGGIDFEDVRLEQENWPELKEKTPFGQLPTLKHNGKEVGQSLAINRYIGHIVKLGGKNEWENLEIDAIADTINDIRIKISAIFYENDEEKKQAIKETSIKETLPYYYSRFEAITQKNNGYLAVGRLTWADVFFAVMTNFFEVSTEATDTLAKYPNLQKLLNTVNNVPNIKKWLEERPKTEW